MRMLQKVAILVCAMSFLAAPALAQGEVKVTADSFVVNEGQSEATFSGNVIIVQEGMTLKAAQAVIHYGSGGPTDLKDFEATGNVEIVTAEQTATGERALYDPSSRILRLTGNVRVVSASGTVTGPELVIDLKTNTSQFSSQSGGRVTGVFKPQ